VSEAQGLSPGELLLSSVQHALDEESKKAAQHRLYQQRCSTRTFDLVRCSEVLEGHEEVQDRCTLTETDERFGFSADDIIDHITNYKDDGDRCPFWTFHCSVHHSPGYLQYIERHNRSNNGGLPTFIRDLLRSIIRAQYPNHPLTLKSNTLASKLFDSSCFEYLDLLIQNLDRTTLDTSWDLTGCVRSLEKASINRETKLAIHGRDSYTRQLQNEHQTWALSSSGHGRSRF
jgi:hypothetical protein